MKTFTFLLLFFLTTFVKAQNPDIFDATWYLYLYSNEAGDTYNADPCDDPRFIYFAPDNTLHGRSMCQEFTGNWGYDSVEEFFWFENFQINDIIPCNNTCYYGQGGPSMIDPIYMSFLSNITFESPVWISVDYTGDARGLRINGAVFDVLVFGDTPLPILSSPDVTKAVFSVYPNPTSNTLKFSSPLNIPINSLAIYSNLGDVILKKTNVTSHSIDISFLNNGLYFIEIISNQGKEIHKFIKK